MAPQRRSTLESLASAKLSASSVPNTSQPELSWAASYRLHVQAVRESEGVIWTRIQSPRAHLPFRRTVGVRNMKILVSLRHPLGLRNFDGVVRELARRGHSVRLSFLSSDKTLAASGPPLLTSEIEGVTSSTLAPRKGEPWLEPSRGLRVLNDALRYRLPMYDGAEKLRSRAFRRLTPAQERFALRSFWRRRFANRAATAVLNHVDACLPPSDVILSDVQEHRPDLILVSPLVDFGSEQVDYIKVARRLGIPTVLAVNSWDNLTNKGRIRLAPDRVLVWNEIQRDEAIRFHGSRAEDVVATGAPVYDRWFDKVGDASGSEFKRRAGLSPGGSYVLYLCSSPFIAEHEMRFVERWLTWLRGHEDPAVNGLEILIRPHPENRQPWGRLIARRLPGVSVWPRIGESPSADQAAGDYFASIRGSRAVIGVNSSGLIEAGVIGRPVLTLLDPDFAATQAGTLHFHYLTQVGGGLLRTARTWEEHGAQLTKALAQSAEEARHASRSFVEQFVRPLGLDVAATPRVVNEILSVAEKGTSRRLPREPWARVVRRLLARGERRASPVADTDHGPPRREPAHALIRRQVEELAASDADTIVLGPWTGGLSAEAVYWLPFVRWAADRLGRERLVAVSRGGVAAWYAESAHEYLDILDYFTPSELGQGTDGPAGRPGDVPRRSTPFDRQVVRVVKQAVGTRKVRTLHPSAVGVLGHRYWKGGPVDALLKCAVAAPLPASGRRSRSGGVFVALHGDGPTQSPDLEPLRALLQALSSRREVVVSGGGPGLWDALGSLPGIRRWAPRCSDSGYAAELIEAVSSTSAFVGLGSDFDLVPALCGVPTLLIRPPDASDQRHVERAQQLVEETGGAGLELASPVQSDLAETVLGLARAGA